MILKKTFIILLSFIICVGGGALIIGDLPNNEAGLAWAIIISIVAGVIFVATSIVAFFWKSEKSRVFKKFLAFFVNLVVCFGGAFEIIKRFPDNETGLAFTIVTAIIAIIIVSIITTVIIFWEKIKKQSGENK